MRASIALSAVADGVAGLTLAMAAGASPALGAMLIGLLASLSLFLFGMSQNDLADIKKDRARSQHRPLASGALSLSTGVVVVLVTASLAAACGWQLGSTAGWLVLSLLLSISLYNLAPGHLGDLGPLVLGAIRAQNLVLGASLLGAPRAALPAAVCYGLYIAVVSSAARMEDGERPPTASGLRLRLRLAQMLVPLAAASVLIVPGASDLTAGLSGGLVAMLQIVFLERALRASVRRGRIEGAPVAALIGACLSAIFLFDAAVCATAGGFLSAGILLLLFPFSRMLARRFPPS